MLRDRSTFVVNVAVSLEWCMSLVCCLDSTLPDVKFVLWEHSAARLSEGARFGRAAPVCAFWAGNTWRTVTLTQLMTVLQFASCHLWLKLYFWSYMLGSIIVFVNTSIVELLLICIVMCLSVCSLRWSVYVRLVSSVYYLCHRDCAAYFSVC